MNTKTATAWEPPADEALVSHQLERSVLFVSELKGMIKKPRLSNKNLRECVDNNTEHNVEACSD
jgi:hypothetical protein